MNITVLLSSLIPLLGLFINRWFDLKERELARKPGASPQVERRKPPKRGRDPTRGRNK
jgi:hypothetical protein